MGQTNVSCSDDYLEAEERRRASTKSIPYASCLQEFAEQSKQRLDDFRLDLDRFKCDIRTRRASQVFERFERDAEGGNLSGVNIENRSTGDENNDSFEDSYGEEQRNDAESSYNRRRTSSSKRMQYKSKNLKHFTLPTIYISEELEEDLREN